MGIYMHAYVKLCCVTLICLHENLLSFPGGHRGVPNQLMYRNNQVMPLDPALVPEPEDAVQQFEAHGGHLTLFSAFGRDPLEDREDLIKARKEDFIENIPIWLFLLHSSEQ